VSNDKISNKLVATTRTTKETTDTPQPTEVAESPAAKAAPAKKVAKKKAAKKAAAKKAASKKAAAKPATKKPENKPAFPAKGRVWPD
jgi:topoisomerase IA-like protein